jgi:serine/threonine protein kinase/thioredoxin-like negative regulator of GroEL
VNDLESVYDRFEAQWRGSDVPPDISAFLEDPIVANHRSEAIFELVGMDIDFRWTLIGETVLIESYFQRFPELGSSTNPPLRLVMEEIEARQRAGDVPTLSEYAVRFPSLKNEISDKFPQDLKDDTAEAGNATIASDNGRGYAEGETFPLALQADADASVNQIGGYEILEKVGVGGMGVVYKAKNLATNRIVALKVIRHGHESGFGTDQYQEALARFKREMEAASKLDHDHVVTVYEVGEENGQAYYAMRFIEGESLKEKLDREQPSSAEAARYTEQVALALAEAHRVGILHRDLKPHNIMVERKNDRALLADFGLAKISNVDQQLTATESVFGTPPYMSPEQTRDSGKVTEAADIYGVGATLYHLLAGRPPFQAASLPETFLQIREKDPVSPRTLNPSVPRDLETICLKCLEKEPNRRYQSATQLAEELACFRRGDPIPTRPISRLEKAWRLCRRHPTVAALSAAVMLTLVLGIVATTFGMLSAIEARRAESRRAEAQESSKLALEKRLQQIEAGNEILSGIFADLDLYQVERPDESLQSLLATRLRAAAEELKGDTVGDPLAVAVLQIQLAVSLKSLGYPIDAVPLLEQSLKTREELLGTEHLDTLTAVAHLGRAYGAAGNYAEALPLLERNLKVRKRILGEDHGDTIKSMSDLALAYEFLGRLPEAIALFEDVVKRNEKAGSNTLKLISAKRRLANAYLAAGRVEEAISLFETAYIAYRGKLGPNHPETLEAHSGWARGLRVTGEFEKALEIMEQVVTRSEDKLGPDHPSTLTYISNLAGLYYLEGDLERATKLGEQSHTRQLETLGKYHPGTLAAKGNLAIYYQASGRDQEALKLFIETFELENETYGEEHYKTLASLQNLALAYQNTGDTRKAIEKFQTALILLEKKLTADHPDCQLCEYNLAVAFQADEQYSEARNKLEKLTRKTLSDALLRSTLDRLIEIADATDDPDSRENWLIFADESGIEPVELASFAGPLEYPAAPEEEYPPAPEEYPPAPEEYPALPENDKSP